MVPRELRKQAGRAVLEKCEHVAGQMSGLGKRKIRTFHSDRGIGSVSVGGREYLVPLSHPCHEVVAEQSFLVHVGECRGKACGRQDGDCQAQDRHPVLPEERRDGDCCRNEKHGYPCKHRDGVVVAVVMDSEIQPVKRVRTVFASYQRKFSCHHQGGECESCRDLHVFLAQESPDRHNGRYKYADASE